MTKRPNEKNERLKRRFLECRKYARQLSDKTLDRELAALERFDVWNGRKGFSKFHIEWAMGFRTHLEQAKSAGDKPLGKSTTRAILATLREFTLWLSQQDGFRSRIRAADADYKGYHSAPLKPSLHERRPMARKYNEENERIKRQYLQFLREAKRSDMATVDKAADAILRFESSTGFKPFKRFHIDQAISFKRQLSSEKSARTGAPLAKATVDGTLRAVKAFILWLAGQPGYKSRIAYAGAEYFNLNAKDARVAHTARDAIYPTPEQCRHAFAQMPDATPLQRRDKALFAFLMLTAARDGAVASLRLKHIDLVQGCVYQDARDVKTKFAKTFTTRFFPVDDAYLHTFRDWVAHLRQDQLFGAGDALFPKPSMGLKDGAFACLGLSRDTYSSAGKLRAVIKDAFTDAGLPSFGPHSFRKTLGILANDHCRTPEQFKAWSMNLGHENIAITLSDYCPVSPSRQGELIRGMA